MKDVLSDFLKKAKIDFTDEQLNQLFLYCTELFAWNKKMNLVKVDSLDNFIINHIIDSLLPLKFFSSCKKINFVDVGSGAGLPGIPLAIFMPETNWTLIERSTKRSSFLNYTISNIKINNRVKVISSDLSLITEKFDIVTFRAFRQFEDFITPLLSLANNNGFVAAYKGTKKLIVEELEKSNIKNKTEILNLNNPFSKNERNLLLIQVTNNF